MRFFIQRVNEAKVTIDGNVTGEIKKGFLVLIGVSDTDTKEIADKLIKKLLNLRIFEDSEGKTNLALKDVGGSLLLVSQFTLYADHTLHVLVGFNASFVHAASAELANELYEYVISQCRMAGFPVETGVFGADMKVSLINDGPFTVLLDSENL